MIHEFKTILKIIPAASYLVCGKLMLNTKFKESNFVAQLTGHMSYVQCFKRFPLI
jgi:hypothetical protein